MRGVIRCVACVGFVLGPLVVWAGGGFDHPSAGAFAPGAQPPATEQLGAVVGSFTFANPPIPANHAVTGIEGDGTGDLYCADSTVPQFFVANTHEPTAQVVEGPFGVQAHSANPIGITLDRSHVYIGDVSAADIDIYDRVGGYLGSFSVAAQTGFPEGITFNWITGNLYVVDGQGGNKVSEYTVDGTWIQNFTINGVSQDGITFDPNRCSYWIFDSGPSGTDTVRHYDLDFVEMESFPGTLAAGFGFGEGVAVIRDRLYIASSLAGVATVVVFDVSDAMESPQIAVCRVFADGFESGDTSSWSSVTP